VALQRAAVLKATDLPAIREYIDEAMTGRALGRDALTRLLDDARAGKISTIYLYKYDRLSRHVATAALLLEELEGLGVEVVSVTEPAEELTRNIMLCVSQDYSRVLGQRARAGMVERFKLGGYTGGNVALGYKVQVDGDKRRLVVDQEEAEVIREVFRSYTQEGVGFYSLAKMLRERGVKTKKGTAPSITSISKILRDPLYIGRRTWGKNRSKLDRTTGKSSRVKTPDATITIEDSTLRIIDQRTWEKAQARLKARSTIGSHGFLGKVSPFTSLVTCGVCGSPVFTKACARKKGATRYLACARKLMQGKDACSSQHYYREERLLARIRDTFTRMFDMSGSLAAEVAAETRKIVDTNQGLLKQAKAEAVKLEGEIRQFGIRLLDNDFDENTKRALGREMSKREVLLAQAQERIASVAESSTVSAAALERAVRKTFDEAKADMLKVASVPQMHEFLTRQVGPLLLTADGKIEQDVSKTCALTRPRPL
jgi:DNA invertase Pin-like site-specific DNA recombinase